MMMLKEIQYLQFCATFGFHFAEFRVWVAVWTFVFGTATVLLEGSFLIKYLTRFSDEILNNLVSTIFITESIKFLIHVCTICMYCFLLGKNLPGAIISKLPKRGRLKKGIGSLGVCIDGCPIRLLDRLRFFMLLFFRQ